MYSNTTITPIGNVTVVTVDEAKAHCNCDVDIWDVQFLQYIKAATAALQVFTDAAFIPSNVSYYVEPDYCNYVNLPFSNNAVLTGESESKYTIKGGRVYLSDTSATITYTAGSEPTDWMKQAVLMYVSDLYENRGESKQGQTGFSTGRADVGEQAKQYCKGFIRHGLMF